MDTVRIEKKLELWKKFSDNNTKVFYSLPHPKEINEFFLMLLGGNGFACVLNFEDCERKMEYWRNVLKIFEENDFVMPYSHSMGFEKAIDMRSSYSVTEATLYELREICGLLEEISHELFELEHVSID